MGQTSDQNLERWSSGYLGFQNDDDDDDAVDAGVSGYEGDGGGICLLRRANFVHMLGG